ncbi:MAG: PKD domain-containing protein [Planctomycetota bacterium]
MHQRPTACVTGAFLAAAACGALSLEGARGADVAVLVGVGDESRVDVAAAGGTLLVVWQDDSGSDIDIRAARVDAAGAVLGAGAFDVCTAAGVQSWPAVASDGTGFLVVWQDERSGTAEVWGARVDSDGNVEETDGFQISSGTGAENYPDVGWTGSAYLVAWQDSRDLGTTDWDIFAARVGTDGAVADQGASAIKVTGAGVQDAAAVAGNGGSALVVCRHGAGNDILGAVVDAGGTPGVPFAVGAATSTQKSPAVAFGRGVYLVAWEDYRDTSGYPDPLNADVYAARVSAAGALLDATHVEVAKTSTTRTASPSVAFDGANFVVAWEDGPDGDSDVYAARVLADAGGITVREPGGLAVSSGVPDRDEPSLAPVGAGALVVWADSRGTDPKDVYAAALGTDDAPLADAGADVLVWWNADVTLDGNASADPEGLPLTYSWVQVPAATVTLLGADTPAPGFTAPGTTDALVFELTVSDGARSATDQVTVTVVAPPSPSSGECGASAAGGSPLFVTLVALAVGVLARRAGGRVTLRGRRRTRLRRQRARPSAGRG